MDQERRTIERKIEDLAQKLVPSSHRAQPPHPSGPGQEEEAQPGDGGEGGEVSRRARKRIFQAIGKLKKRLDELHGKEEIENQEEQHVDTPSDSESEGNSKRRKTDSSDCDDTNARPTADSAKSIPRKVLKARLKLLNDELSSLARNKQAKKAEKRIELAIRKGIPVDVHSYTNLINAHVRCGNINRAKEIVVTMKAKGIQPNTVTLTTLIKGLCEHGLVEEAVEMILQPKPEVFSSSDAIRPNVRTASTVLRGCLRIGDVNSAMSIYRLMLSEWNLKPDRSCVDYLVTMLCQSLRILEAENIVTSFLLNDVSTVASNKESSEEHLGNDYDPLSNAFVFVCLARASAVLADWDRAASYCECATKALAETLHYSKMQKGLAARNVSSAAADRTSRSTVAGDASARMFEEHRRDGLARDADSIRNYISRAKTTGADTALLNSVNVFSRLLHFSKDNHITGAKIVEISKISYGLERLCNRAGDSKPATLPDLYGAVSSKVLASFPSPSSSTPSSSALTAPTPHCATINFRSVFSRIYKKGKGMFQLDTSDIQMPIKLEIGSGMGEWICNQAIADAGRALWVAMELRSDRSNEIATRSLLTGAANNLSVLCGDAHRILESHIPAGCISEAFINHPQPPDRADRGKHGNSSDGKHLLTPEFFKVLHRALLPGGTITIVTDNQQYAHQLINEFHRSLSHLFREKITTSVNVISAEDTGRESSHQDRVVQLHRLGQQRGAEAFPLSRFGHVADASSYFDRLWNRGDKTQRWVIFIQTV